MTARIVCEGGSIVYGYGPPVVTSFCRMVAGTILARPNDKFAQWKARETALGAYLKKSVLVQWYPQTWRLPARPYSWTPMPAPVIVQPGSCLIVHPGDDLVNTITPGAYNTYVINLRTYLLDKKRKGWQIIVCTVLPRVVAGFDFNAWATRLNTEIRTWKGSYCHDICDLAAHPLMGRSYMCNDTRYYTGGIYPTILGHSALKTLLYDKLKTLHIV